MKIKHLLLAIIILSFFIGTIIYPRMPNSMASHWNAQGNVDGYMQKFWGVFLMPMLSAALFLLFVFIPKIDPLKQNIEHFRGYYESFILLLLIFLFYTYLLTLAWNLGIRLNMTQMLLPAFGLLFYYIGVLLKHSKRNWFVGIRTPWTLSSDLVWEKTHKLCSKLFKVSGALVLLSTFFLKNSLTLVIAPALASSLLAVLYSYYEYQKLQNKA